MSRKEKVTQNDVVLFCRGLSTMIDAGLPMIQCLEILHSQQENAAFRKVLQDIKASVEGGMTLTQALAKYPKQFDDHFVNMIAAGEAGGILETILRRLSFTMEKAARFKREIKGAMVLPVIFFGIAAVVTGAILASVIPVLRGMLEGMGGALPLPAQSVVDLSNFLKGSIPYIIIIVVGSILLGIGYRQFGKTGKGRTTIDTVKLRLPVLGELLRKANLASFTRTMGTMLSAGVGMQDALEITAKTVRNVVFERAAYTVRSGVAEGRGVYGPLQETGAFPQMVCQMVAVGETVGGLDSTLNKIADFYDEEVDLAAGSMPWLILTSVAFLLGIVVCGLVAGMAALYLQLITL